MAAPLSSQQTEASRLPFQINPHLIRKKFLTADLARKRAKARRHLMLGAPITRYLAARHAAAKWFLCFLYGDLGWRAAMLLPMR